MKKFLLITTAVVAGIGGSLQAAYTTMASKTVQPVHFSRGPVTKPGYTVVVPQRLTRPVHVTDPKKMQTMIKDLQKKINTAVKKRNHFEAKRLKFAEKGNKKQVALINGKIQVQQRQINMYRLKLKNYVSQLAFLKKSELASKKAKK